MLKKSIGILLVICVISNTFLYTTFAKSRKELEEEKEYYKEILNNVNQEIEKLEQQKTEILEKIDEKNQEVVDLSLEIQQAKESIENTKTEISDIEKKIRKEKVELAEATLEKNKQYKNMKKRIQFIYEKNSGEKELVSLLQSKSIQELLNKKEYINSLSKIDKELLEKFIQTIAKIERIKKELENSREELIEKKNLLEKEKIALEEKEQDLQEELMILQSEEMETDVNIQSNKRDAATLANEIADISREIKQKIAEQNRIREEQQFYLAQINYESSIISNSDIENYFSDTEEEQEQIYLENEYIEEEYDTPVNQSSADIVSYAEQFLGNPYVWGGNSLTNGCDCSHFVYNVLKDTGYYDGEYYTSGSWASLGSSVDSLSSAQAGDVIVYSGHVAIYDGEGKIIEAKGSKYGITHDRDADCKSIVAIRRFN